MRFRKMFSAGGHVATITLAPASASDFAIANPNPPSSATPATSARRPVRSILSIPRYGGGHGQKQGLATGEPTHRLARAEATRGRTEGIIRRLNARNRELPHMRTFHVGRRFASSLAVTLAALVIACGGDDAPALDADSALARD